MVGVVYLPIILCGSFHQQQCPVAQWNPNLLHVGVVTVLLLTKNTNI